MSFDLSARPSSLSATIRPGPPANIERRPVNPENLRYTADHEWVGQVGDVTEGALRLGITAFAQEALGDIVFVTLPVVGQDLQAREPLGEVESTKSVSDVYAPFAGVVTARNEQLEETPELVNNDPYGDGWLVEIRPSDGVSAALESPDLLDAAAYGALSTS